MRERQTKQKQIIYEALTALDHPTATEVYGYVREMQPSVSRATVFRVLGGFVSGGRAQELRFAGNEVRYDDCTEAHYHARCVDCGRVVDVRGEKLPYREFSSIEKDFSIEGYSVEFFGRCGRCREGNSQTC